MFDYNLPEKLFRINKCQVERRNPANALMK